MLTGDTQVIGALLPRGLRGREALPGLPPFGKCDESHLLKRSDTCCAAAARDAPLVLDLTQAARPPPRQARQLRFDL